jgi:tape measure domain-containing protein
MNLFSLYAKIGLDTSEYEKKVKQSKTYSQSLEKELQKVSSEVKNLESSYKDSVSQTGRYSDETKDLAEKLKDAKKRQSELTQELEKGSSSASKYAFNLQNLGSAITTGLKVATTAGIGFIATLGKIGLDYNSQMETYTTNFEVMLGDTAAAAQKVQDISDMAAKTPFELTDLASATQTLLAFNVANEDTNTVLQQLGDISLGNTQKLDSLTQAYGKMNASQKVTLEDINMMIDAGYNPLLNVQEKTGESMDELYDRISAGEVSFTEIQEAISSATSEGGQFYQGMDKASQTTQGLVSTLQDVVKSKAGEFFQGVSDKIKEALPDVISFVENIDVTEVTNTIKGLYDRFVELSPVIAGVIAAVVAFRTAMTIAAIIQGVSTAITAFKKANDAATISQALLNAVMNLNPFILIATLIAGVVVALITLWNTNEDFRNTVINIWNAVKEFISSAIEAIVGFFENLVEFITNLPEKIKEIFDDIVQKALDLGKNIIDSIINGISDAWDGLVSWFTGLWDSLFGNRSVDVNVNANGSGVNGSHANGLDYVPFDGYIAELHKGETVLTAQEAEDYRSGRSGGITVVQNIYSQAKTAADLMREARHAQERAVLLGV